MQFFQSGTGERPSASTRQTSPAIAMPMREDNKPRPSCNCKTSRCFWRYCHCFDNQWYCSDACRCESCTNTEAREAFVEERDELSKARAFQSKGCTCRKSECKKNYCECFKNRVACTERCQCEGCANTYGAKGGTTILLHNNDGSGGTTGDDSSGTSDGGSGSGTPDGSDGTSNETAVIIDEDSLSPTEARVKENVVAFWEPLDIGKHVYTPSDSDLYAFFKSFSYQHCFSQNVHNLMHRGSMQTLQHGTANSTPQGLLNPNINSSSQDGPSGS